MPTVGAAAAEQRGGGHLRVQDLVQLPAQLNLALEIYLHGEPVEDFVELRVPEVGEVAVGLLARGLVDTVAGPDGRAQVGPSQARGVGDYVKRSGDLPVHHRGDLHDLELGLHPEEPLPLGLRVGCQLPILG